MVEEGSDEVEEDLWEVGGRGEARVPGSLARLCVVFVRSFLLWGLWGGRRRRDNGAEGVKGAAGRVVCWCACFFSLLPVFLVNKTRANPRL